MTQFIFERKGRLTSGFIILFCFLSAMVSCTHCSAELPLLSPGNVWLDSDGQQINAHGGCLLEHEGAYYFFGEYKGDSTYQNMEVKHWECYRADSKGISCYKSEDLHTWQFVGVALDVNVQDSTSDLNPSQVLERPKVIYNETTRKFVMWLHIDNADYTKGMAGVAIADTPQGPYQYLRSVKPNKSDSRDQTLFKDDDGTAYHIYSSEDNATLHIGMLDPTYTNHTPIYKRIFNGRYREAPALFKRQNKYYLITSGCTGWVPNAAEIAVADSIMGEWTVIGNPCVGDGAEFTFGGQSCHVFEYKQNGKEAFLAMFDIWNKENLIASRYMWLPIDFSKDKPTIEYK